MGLDLNDRLRQGVLPEDLMVGEAFEPPPLDPPPGGGDPRNGTGDRSHAIDGPSEGFGGFGGEFGHVPEDETWPDPLPLEAPSKPFDTENLPDGLRAWVEAQAGTLQVDPAMMSSFAIGALGGAAGGKVKIDLGHGWTEKQSGLYLAVIARPGERKSVAIDRAIGPIHDVEREESEARRSDVARAVARIGGLKKRLASLQAAAGNVKAKPAERDRFNRELSDVADELDRAQQEAPSLPRLIAGDATPEALAALLFRQHERLCIASAEGGEVFSLASGRYGNRPAPEALLRGWSCDQVSIDRKSSDPVTLREPALQVVLAVQPDVIRGVGDVRELKDRGALERFLFCIPSPRGGTRTIDVDPVPEALQRTYRDAVSTMARWRIDRGDRFILRLGPEAQERFDDFRQKLERKLGPGGDLADVIGWASKVAGNLARVAALYHLWTLALTGYLDRDDLAPCHAVIEGDAMRQALASFPFWGAHTQRAFGLLRLDPAMAGAVFLLAWIRRNREGKRRVTFRKIQQSCKRRFDTTDDLRASIHVLEDAGYLRREPPKKHTAGRPPEPTFIVNPKAWKPAPKTPKTQGV